MFIKYFLMYKYISRSPIGTPSRPALTNIFVRDSFLDKSIDLLLDAEMSVFSPICSHEFLLYAFQSMNCFLINFLFLTSLTILLFGAWSSDLLILFCVVLCQNNCILKALHYAANHLCIRFFVAIQVVHLLDIILSWFLTNNNSPTENRIMHKSF